MVKYSDDIVLLAENREGLEQVLNGIDRLLRNAFGIKINKSKTEVIKSSGNENNNHLNIKIGKEKVGEIGKFTYLGSRITRDRQSRKELRAEEHKPKELFQKEKFITVKLYIGN